MSNVLDILSKDHKKWLQISKSFGLTADAEDLVQEMYLKVYAWNGKYNKTLMFNETEVNYYFVFRVLRGLFLDKVKVKQPKKISLETLSFYEPSISDISFEYQTKLDKIKKEIKSWAVYDQKIYELIFLENYSMLQLSKKTGIDYYSIYRTVKKIKKILNKQL